MQQVVALRDSLERLRRNVENCAATIVQLSAALDRLELGESETETPQSDNQVEVVVETVHGLKDKIRLPKRNP